LGEVYEEGDEEQQEDGGGEGVQALAIRADAGTVDSESGRGITALKAGSAGKVASKGGAFSQQTWGSAIAPGLEGQLGVYPLSPSSVHSATPGASAACGSGDGSGSCGSQQLQSSADGGYDGGAVRASELIAAAYRQQSVLQQQQQEIHSHMPGSGYSLKASATGVFLEGGLDNSNGSDNVHGRLVMRPAAGHLRIGTTSMGVVAGKSESSSKGMQVMGGKRPGGGDVP
jgi:hypothetical protein